MKPYMPIVVEILNKQAPSTILDAPSGEGWLQTMLKFDTKIDGIDFFENKPNGYRDFQKADLDFGIPKILPKYDAVVSCEGIEHIGNPMLFLKTIKEHLNKNGAIIITTPNTWHPAAKIQYLIRGFFPSFPCLVGKIHRGTHMHITAWTFPQLFLYLSLAGYVDIESHEINEKKPNHFFERIFGLPQMLYCRNKYNKLKTKEEEIFWKMSGGRQSVFGRRLVVSARVND